MLVAVQRAVQEKFDQIKRNESPPSPTSQVSTTNELPVFSFEVAKFCQAPVSVPDSTGSSTSVDGTTDIANAFGDIKDIEVMGSALPGTMAATAAPIETQQKMPVTVHISAPMGVAGTNATSNLMAEAKALMVDAVPAAHEHNRSIMVCCHWKNKGFCRMGAECKFQHPAQKRGIGAAASDFSGGPPGSCVKALFRQSRRKSWHSGSAAATGIAAAASRGSPFETVAMQQALGWSFPSPYGLNGGWPPASFTQ